MKKLISTLAAFALICGSFAGISSPSVSVSSASAAGVGAADIYDFEDDSQEPVDTIEQDGLVFNIYENDDGKYAVLKSVTDDTITELSIPSLVSDDGRIWVDEPDEVIITIEVVHTPEGDETIERQTVHKRGHWKNCDIKVVGIEYGAFKDCADLKNICLSENIAVINWLDIAEQGFEEIKVSDDNENFTVVDNVLYTKDMKTLVACPPASGKTELKLPAETEAIAEGAFACCKNLKMLELTENVKDIAPLAFYGCNALEEIKLPEGIKNIPNGTFAGCSSLRDLIIPDSVEHIDSSAFKDAGCIENENGLHYVDKWLVGSDLDIELAVIREGTVGTAEYLFVTRNHLKKIVVPSSVKHVGSYLAFGINMPLEYVDFHCSEIPDRCITCLNVKEIDIYDPHCRIADSAGAFPSYWREPEEYTGKVREEEWDYTLSHKTTTIGSANSTASSIQRAAYAVLTEITDDDYEEEEPDIATITRAGAENSNTADTISDEKLAEKIKNYMEKNAKSKSAPDVYKAPVKAGRPVRYDTVICGYEGSTAQAYALKYRRCFTEFPKATACVGPESFFDSEAGIKYYIYGSDNASACLYGDHSEFKNVVIPDEINGVPVNSFIVNCNLNAGTVTLPASIEYFNDSIDLQYDNTQYYIVSEDNPWFRSVDGIIYNKDMTELVKVPSNYESDEIVIPDTVKTIRRGAFHSLRHVRSVILPEGLEIIGANAFCGADKLCKIYMPETLDTICDNAFNGCTALEEILIPENVKHIGFNAFDDCPAVEYENGHGYLEGWLVDVNDSVTDVSPRYDTKGIARVSARNSITIPAGVTKMSWELIPYDCYSITKRADVFAHKIDFDAFKNALFMKDIYIYDPECEICEGSQTIPAKYLEFDEDNEYIKTIFDVPHSCNALSRTLYEGLHQYRDTSIADTVIHGYKGSTAELYAKLYGLKFSALEDEPVYRNGDLNGDGLLAVSDFVYINRYIAGKAEFTKQQFMSADLNGDGNVDVFDLVEYRKALLSEIK